MAPELQSRDLAALLFTWQSRYVTATQLQRAFWRDASLSAAARRLVVLRKAGLLGFRAFPWLSERQLYFPNPRGNRVLAACGLLPEAWIRDHPRRPEELSPALRHDLSVVDLRLGLEESGADGRTWVSDHQLRLLRWRPGREGRVPDGVFAFTRDAVPGRGLLEYERVAYGRRQAGDLLTRLRIRYPDHTAFIVCRTRARAETFRIWAQESGVYGGAQRAIAFCDLEAAAKDGLDGGFVDLGGRPWTLRDS